MVCRAQVALRPVLLSVQSAQHATLDARYMTSLQHLSSVLGGLAVDPATGQVDQSTYECGLAIGKASVAIEKCYRGRTCNSVSILSIGDYQLMPYRSCRFPRLLSPSRREAYATRDA